jgi:hypothetical protein
MSGERRGREREKERQREETLRRAYANQENEIFLCRAAV